MKKELLKEIIKKKINKTEFAIITNLNDGESCIYQKDKPLSKNFEVHKENIAFLNADVVTTNPSPNHQILVGLGGGTFCIRLMLFQ